MNRRGFIKIAPAIICSKGLYRGATNLIVPLEPAFKTYSFEDLLAAYWNNWQSKSHKEILRNLDGAFVNFPAATTRTLNTAYQQ